MTLSGTTAVVTGGNSGIGRAVASRLAGSGSRVVIVARDRERGEDAVREIREDGGDARFVRADVRRPEELEGAFEEAAGGNVDLLFANAGYEGPVAPLEALPAEEVDRLVDTNLKGTVHTLRAGLPRLADGGSVVCNASFLGTVPFPAGAVYGATKAAVIQLTESVAEAGRERGIRAYTVCPFNTDTPMIRRLAESDAITRDQLAEMNPGGRLLRPAEVASVVVDLLAGRRDEPSGSALLVNAGPEVEPVG